jgi:3-oxoacyl-ACP reductase-like protein
VNTFVRLLPVLFACVATQVIAGDPPTPKSVDADKPTAPAVAASADGASAAKPAQGKADPETTASAATKPERLVLDDKTLTNAEVSQLLSQGYRPQKGRGDDVLYCRSEQPLGTRFAQKVCKSADQIKAQIRDSKDMAARQQMPSGNPAGK